MCPAIPRRAPSFLGSTDPVVRRAGLTTFHTSNRHRQAPKLVRKLPKSPCKPAEVTAFANGDAVGAKCQASLEKSLAPLLGADAVAGSKNLLVLLRGPRLGQLAVLDAKSLTEKTAINVAWCEDGGDEKKKPADEASDE